MVYISRIETEWGDWEITGSEQGITGVGISQSFVHGREHPITRQAAEELLAYLHGSKAPFTVPLDLQGTPFQMAVWQALRTIPYGQTVGYGEVAQMIGNPRAVRAAAQAIGRNPCLIFVPCHRVLGKNGALTGFSAGLPLKERLLDLEGISYRT